MQIDFKNELCMKLCEFIYETASKLYRIQIWNIMNETIGTRLEKLHKLQIINNDDMKLLRDVYNCIINNDNSRKNELIQKIDQLINKIYENDFNYLIGLRKEAGDDYNFLDSLEDALIDVHNEMISIIRRNETSSYSSGQIFDDFELMIDIIEKKDILINLDEETLCKELNIVYYNPDLHWADLKKWLISKGCPKEYLGDFSLRFNALYAMYIKENNPEISIEEMLKDRELI